MDTDVRGQTNVEQREERAEIPVCLVLQADGVKERGNGTASLVGKVPAVPDGANNIQSAYTRPCASFSTKTRSGVGSA
jgi:hypothetical protein